SDPDVPLFVNSEDSVDDVLNDHVNTNTNTSNLSIHQKERTKPKVDKQVQNTIVGSALKRGPNGDLIIPIKKKKKKRSKKFELLNQNPLQQNYDDDSFDSSDSQYDVDKEIAKNDIPNSVIEKQSLAETSCGKQSFKEWAVEQLGIGFKSPQHIDTSNHSQLSSNVMSFQKKCVNSSEQVAPNFVIQDGIDITADDYIENNGSNNNTKQAPENVKKAFYVPVKRSQEIQIARMELPVCEEEQTIMEAINQNSVVVICGETGSGKTTQLPQFLYEAGFGNPESVCVNSIYNLIIQIRYDATISPKTVIKFMTDGVLLRELSGDFLLSKYSAIIIDEAHERSLNTDILIGVIRILVFMTGQNEISILCKKLRNKFPYISSNQSYQSSTKIKEESQIDEPYEHIREGLSTKNELVIGENDQGYIDHHDNFDTDSEDSVTEFENDELDNEYGLLSQYDHLLGTRLCVVATNVAETSLTIPGITYVVDCGKVKERRYNANTGVQSFVIDWISKASADQRAGRAGRTGPGHCYRLYSSAVFNDQFQQFTIPEIHRTPIEGVILQMKAMNIDTVSNFPFPTPPDRDQLKKAEKLLQYMGALDENSQITSLGRAMATFPLAPRFSKMLIIGQQHECLPYVIAIVSALSVGDPFIREYHLDGTDSDSDCDKDESEDYVQTKELNEIQKEIIFKKERRKLMRKRFYDVQKAMQEIHKLRGQITNIVQTNCHGVDVYVDPKMKPPSAIQLEALRQIIAAGFIDQVAIRKDVVDGTGKTYSSTRGITYSTMWTDEDVFVHPSSVLYHEKPPDFVVYQELQRTNKVWMK
ncbi:1193_t:CDS:2, partial [Racocetra fulgida]